MRDELNDLMRAEARAAANADTTWRKRVGGTYFDDIPDARDLMDTARGGDGDWSDS